MNYSDKRHYFWFGEVGMASILAGVFAIPFGIFLAGRAENTLAFTGAVVLFLPLFVFFLKILQQLMKPVDAVVFWTLFISMAGLVLASVVDPVTAQRVIGVITGMGV